MGQAGYAENFVELMLGWMRQMASSIAGLFQSGGGQSGGKALLDWFSAHWLGLLLVLIAIGVAVDWIVWMIRWRPYWLWFHKRRVILDDGVDHDFGQDELLRRYGVREDSPRFHSRALPREDDLDDPDTLADYYMEDGEDQEGYEAYVQDEDGDLPYEDEDLPYEDADLPYEDEDPSYEDGDLPYEDEDPSYEDEDLSYEDEDLSYEDEDLGNQESEDQPWPGLEASRGEGEWDRQDDPKGEFGTIPLDPIQPAFGRDGAEYGGPQDDGDGEDGGLEDDQDGEEDRREPEAAKSRSARREGRLAGIWAKVKESEDQWEDLPAKKPRRSLFGRKRQEEEEDPFAVDDKAFRDLDDDFLQVVSEEPHPEAEEDIRIYARPEARRQVELEPLEISPQAGEQEEYDERIGYQSSFAPLSGTARSRKARRKKQAEQQEDEQD